MALHKVTAPAGVTKIAGVSFANGVAEVDDTNPRKAKALAYFRRKAKAGYKVEPAAAVKPAAKKAAVSAPEGDSR